MPIAYPEQNFVAKTWPLMGPIKAINLKMSTDDRPRSTAHLIELQNLFSFGSGLKVDNQNLQLSWELRAEIWVIHIGVIKNSQLFKKMKTLWGSIDLKGFKTSIRDKPIR